MVHKQSNSNNGKHKEGIGSNSRNNIQKQDTVG